MQAKNMRFGVSVLVYHAWIQLHDLTAAWHWPAYLQGKALSFKNRLRKKDKDADAGAGASGMFELTSLNQSVIGRGRGRGVIYVTIFTGELCSHHVSA